MIKIILKKDLKKIIREQILLSMCNKNNIYLSWINLVTDDIKNEIIFNKTKDELIDKSN